MDNGLEDLRSCIQDALDEVSPGSRLWRVVSDVLANNGSSHPLGLPRRPGRRPLIGWKSRLPPPVSRPIHVKNMKEAGIPSWLCNIRLSATVCETRDRGACTQHFFSALKINIMDLYFYTQTGAGGRHEYIRRYQRHAATA